MPSITREQIVKWNAKANNGFLFNHRHYVIFNEKELTKHVQLEDGRIIEFTINYHEDYRTRTTTTGYDINESTGYYVPYLDVTVWRPTSSGMYTSGGWARSHPVGKNEKKKNYAALCKISAEIDTDSLVKEILAKEKEYASPQDRAAKEGMIESVGRSQAAVIMNDY